MISGGLKVNDKIINEVINDFVFDMHTVIHRGEDGLKSIREYWEGLHNYCELWSRYEWYYAYLTNLAFDSEHVYFIQIFAGNKTVAIIPAEITIQKIDPFGNLKVLCLAFHSHIPLTDFPIDPHFDSFEIATQMIIAFRQLPIRWDVIRWPRILQSSSAFGIARLIGVFPVYFQQASLCNFIDSSKTYDEVCNNFSKNLQSHLKKSRKRITNTDNWCVVSSNEGEDFMEFYDEFLRLESSGWKGDSGTGSAIHLNDSMRSFYNNLLEQRNTDFIPEVTLLLCGPRAVAGQFSIWVSGCKQILKIGYDEKDSKLSPGQILMDEVIKNACTSPSIERVSLVTNMQWHKQWNPNHNETVDVIIFRQWWLGILFSCYVQARKIVKVIVGWLKTLKN